MGRTERRKGVRGELEVAAIFRAVGFDCDRTPNSGGLRVKGDLAGSVPAHIEVKRQETLRLPSWLRQAQLDAPLTMLPVVAFRQSRDIWYAAVPLYELAAMMAEIDRFRALYPDAGIRETLMGRLAAPIRNDGGS